jgi:hypothetical protein
MWIEVNFFNQSLGNEVTHEIPMKNIQPTENDPPAGG